MTSLSSATLFRLLSQQINYGERRLAGICYANMFGTQLGGEYDGYCRNQKNQMQGLPVAP